MFQEGIPFSWGEREYDKQGRLIRINHANNPSDQFSQEYEYYEPNETTMISLGSNILENELHYYNEKGILTIGWFEVDDKQYYAGKDRKLYKEREYEVDGKKYLFDSNGICLGEL